MTIFYIIMNKSIKKLICVSLFSMCAVSLKAQNLPELYSIGVGGGLSASAAKTNASYSFFEKNGNRLGYNLNMDSRFYFCEWFALGLQYDYNNIQKGKDKAHVHFVRPALTLRYVLNRSSTSALVCSTIRTGFTTSTADTTITLTIFRKTTAEYHSLWATNSL